MMSRITIDLRKDLSREVMVGDEGSLHTYQLTHIRFRDMSANGVRRLASTLEQNTGNLGVVTDTNTSRVARGPADPLITTRDSD